MRGTVHCLGLMLLLSGGLGLICLAILALQMLETAFQMRPVVASESVKQPRVSTMENSAPKRVPFVLMP